MTLLILILIFAGLTVVLLCLALYKMSVISNRNIDWSPVVLRIEEAQRSHGQIRELILGEFSLNRQEFVAQNQSLRTDVMTSAATASESLSGSVDKLVRSTDQRLELLRNGIDQRFDVFGVETGRNSDQLSKSVTESATLMRTDVNERLNEFRGSLETSVRRSHDVQREQTQFITSSIQTLQTDADQRQGRFENLVELKLSTLSQDTTGKLTSGICALNDNAKQLGEETGGAMKQVGDTLVKAVTDMTQLQKSELQELRATVDSRLVAIQADNEKKLEQMRQTVDEKLQGTLETRLGESFKQVSQRLEEVCKGLGEMRSLAMGVGDLKKVLTNVKTRGTWGEVQLGALLEQILAPEQYAANVDVRGTGERVEFAIKLPGRDTNSGPVWLPIDAKFPLEDYQRLVDASEQADPEAVERATRQLEATLKSGARNISEKYVVPPATTDFGILFLPTEGLYAEAVRRPALAETIQREYRVILAGPSTLAALLNSLQMGFRTLAIQQRSSEVWELLGAVKTEFGKYADVLTRVRKKLDEANSTIEKAEVRTRAIHKQLRSVESVDSGLLITLEEDIEEETLPLPVETASSN